MLIFPVQTVLGEKKIGAQMEILVKRESVDRFVCIRTLIIITCKTPYYDNEY